MLVATSWRAGPHALVVRWPGVGYWSFPGGCYVPSLRVPDCLLPLSPDPDDPGTLMASVPEDVCGSGQEVILRLVALADDGGPAVTVGVETIRPGSGG